MQPLQSARSHTALRPFVRAYAQRAYRLFEPVTEPSLPSVDPVLVFLFGPGFSVRFSGAAPITPPKTALVGANLGFGTQLLLHGEVHLFAIFFQPAGFTDLFGIPARHLTNRYHDATDVCPGAAALWDRLAEEPSFADRVHVAENVLLARLSRVPRPGHRHAVNEILRTRGMARVTNMARSFGVSVRQFERRFVDEVGTTPKAFARVARFQFALDAKIASPKRTWLDIAATLGYADQMHLIHDFRHLSGSSPQGLLATLGDARPAAVVDSSRDVGIVLTR